MASESKKTVVVAMAANMVIAVAKTVAGFMTGSSAMLAEAVHSLADTTNELFMLLSLSLGAKKPDAEHPFGYGKERFFWAFVCSVFIVISGAAFSIFKGVSALRHPSEGTSASSAYFFGAYIVLAVALVSEGTSLIRAFRQVKSEHLAADPSMRFWDFLWKSKNPTDKLVLLEDSAAVVGVMFAALGLALYQYTGNEVFDATASIAIGILMGAMAVTFGADAKGLLLGESALPGDRRRIHEIIARHDGIREVVEVLTMATGPSSLLVAARIHVEPQLRGNELERVARDIDSCLRLEVPAVSHVFLDPTSRHERIPREDQD